MEVVPLAEGEIGSVASVRFRADATSRTKVTRPELEVDVTAPEQVRAGEELALAITVKNVGTGVARTVVIEEDVPAGLKHAAGRELEYEIGDLAPGESRSVRLILGTTKPGKVRKPAADSRRRGRDSRPNRLSFRLWRRNLRCW